MDAAKSPSRRNPCSVAAILVMLSLVCLAGAVAWPGTGGPPAKTVPRFVAEAAEASLADFAYALAEARIPAGFVAFQSDFFDDGFERPVAAASGYRSGANEGEVPLETAVAALRTRNRAYDVEEHTGVVLVRAREIELGVGPFGRRTDRFRIDGQLLPTAFNEGMRIVDPTIPVRGGYVGSLLSGPDKPTPVIAPPPTITLDVRNATFVDALNEIVKQAPGTVWIVSRHARVPERTYYTLAYRTRGGGITRCYDELR